MKKSLSNIVVTILFATSGFAQDKIYKVGDAVLELGGIVIYVDKTGKHGIVCADIDQGEFIWGCRLTEINGADGAEIYDGKQNTKDILAGCPKEKYDGKQNTTAAKICDNLVLYGFSDWYLPSKEELDLMYENLHRKGIGNFDEVTYWSSTEVDSKTAWGRSFFIGNQSGGPVQKNSPSIVPHTDGYRTSTTNIGYRRRVRATRAF